MEEIYNLFIHSYLRYIMNRHFYDLKTIAISNSIKEMFRLVILGIIVHGIVIFYTYHLHLSLPEYFLFEVSMKKKHLIE